MRGYFRPLFNFVVVTLDVRGSDALDRSGRGRTEGPGEWSVPASRLRRALVMRATHVNLRY
ncbi:hypothetical protein BH686_05985 [Rhodococcus erythropolis]|nr:hypothetical protein BH686_05985 [Rhodococcus erythropolis]